MKIFGMGILGFFLGALMAQSTPHAHGPGGIGTIFDMVVGAFFGCAFGCAAGLVWQLASGGKDAGGSHPGVVAEQLYDVEANPYQLSPVPHTGKWTARLDPRHSQERAFSSCVRSFDLLKGDAFPDPNTILAGVDASSVRWVMRRSGVTGQQTS
ncbi:MAG: hypothetical protein JWQ88_2914 [Rhodoferax sp.]|nr:hypothetical protein [Rhodoferax sp.]